MLHQVMPVNYRIGGAVWGSRVQYEPLTDTMNLLPLLHQGPGLLRLARQMQALCLCVKELLAEYNVQPAGISTKRSCLYADGVPCELHDETRFGATSDHTCMQHDSKSLNFLFD